jgi:hypothetical protein
MGSNRGSRCRSLGPVLALFLALVPAGASATHLGLEQLGLESAHAETWVAGSGIPAGGLLFGTHPSVPFVATHEANAVPLYTSALTSLTGHGPADADARVVFSPGTFPLLRLTAASDVAAPSGESVAQAFAYFQDEITITVASLPPNTLLSFSPSFGVSGSLSATDDLSRPGISTFEVWGARLNAGLGGTLAADARFLGDRICTPGDPTCGAFALTFGTLPASPGIDFFNGSPFTFKFLATVIAANTARADLGTTIGWLGATVRDSGGNPVNATFSSGTGIDYTLPSVPEPGSGGLLVLATLGLLQLRRWRG